MHFCCKTAAVDTVAETLPSGFLCLARESPFFARSDKPAAFTVALGASLESQSGETVKEQEGNGPIEPACDKGMLFWPQKASTELLLQKLVLNFFRSGSVFLVFFF